MRSTDGEAAENARLAAELFRTRDGGVHWERLAAPCEDLADSLSYGGEIAFIVGGCGWLCYGEWAAGTLGGLCLALS